MAKNRKVVKEQHPSAEVGKNKKLAGVSRNISSTHPVKKRPPVHKKNQSTQESKTTHSSKESRKNIPTEVSKKNDHTKVSKKTTLIKVLKKNVPSKRKPCSNVVNEFSCPTAAGEKKLTKRRKLPERMGKQKSSVTGEETVPVIGIDLGTTNTVAAVWNGEDYVVIADKGDHKLTPSMVFYHGEEGKVEVGAKAYDNALEHPKALIHDSKRFIGRNFSEAPVVGDYKWYPLTLSAEHGHVTMQVENEAFKEWITPKDAAAAILNHVAEYASHALEKRVRDVVVTVPSNFTLAQKQETSAAAEQAGLRVLQILNEPTAAAMAYTNDLNLEDEEIKTIFVFDMGGSTLDICVMEVSRESYQTVAMAGHERIGGKNFDLILADYCVEEYKNQKRAKHGDLSDVQKLKLHKACEEAKIQLSNETDVTVEIPLSNQKNPFKVKLNQSMLLTAGGRYLAAMDEMINNALEDAKMTAADIDEVLLVGGATRMPCIKNLVYKHFPDNRMIQRQNVDEVVAIGAAILGESLRRNKERGRQPKQRYLQDVTPISLGVSVFGNTMEVIVPRFTHLPTKVCKLFTTTHRGQTEGIIQILEGEDSDSERNRELCKFIFDGITKGPRGMASLLITFEVNGNNDIRVSVVDSASMKEMVVRILTATRRTKLDAPVVRKRVQQTRDDRKFHREMRDLVYYLNKIKLTVYDLGELVSKKDYGITAVQKKNLKRGLAPFQEWLATEASRTYKDVLVEWKKLYKFCVQLPTDILQKAPLENLPMLFKKENEKPVKVCKTVELKRLQEKRKSTVRSTDEGSKKLKVDDFYCRPGGHCTDSDSEPGFETDYEGEERITTKPKRVDCNKEQDKSVDDQDDDGQGDGDKDDSPSSLESSDEEDMSNDGSNLVGKHGLVIDTDSSNDEISEEEQDDVDDEAVNWDKVTDNDDEDDENDQREDDKNSDDGKEGNNGKEGNLKKSLEAKIKPAVGDADEISAVSELDATNGPEQNGLLLAAIVQNEDEQ